ncbi:MAG TPA: hypothetical protein VF533_04620, partial [Solirubrobacteraceae bacterium]
MLPLPGTRTLLAASLLLVAGLLGLDLATGDNLSLGAAYALAPLLAALRCRPREVVAVGATALIAAIVAAIVIGQPGGTQQAVQLVTVAAAGALAAWAADLHRRS